MKAGDILKQKRKRFSPIDVMLIHVDSFYNNIYSYFNMGLLYIGTYLREQGYRVKCMGINDFMYLSLEQIASVFKNGRPSIVGFYTVSDNIYQVERFASQVKEWSPRTQIIAGGPLATSIGKKILDSPHIDMVMVGEGEFSMKALADFVVLGEGSIREIPGLIYRFHGETVFNPPAPPIEDLDALPYPDQDLSGVYRSFHIVSGRGCPYNCIFCFQGVHGLKYRYRSAENVVGEIIGNLEKYNARSFDIIDDTFISNPKRVIEVADRLREYREASGRDFRFFCQGRVDIMEKHPEMLVALKKAGCCRVQVGIESGDPRILRLYRKRIEPKQIKKVVKQAGDLGGMVVVGNFILGGPFEDEGTFSASVNLAKDLMETAPGAFEVGTAYLGPYPGTEIAEFPSRYGLKVFDDRFKKGLTLSDCHFTSEAFGVKEIRQLSPRFEAELSLHMEKLIPKIPRELLKAHFDWGRDYWIMTQWYLSFLRKREALEEYFNYMRSPRFATLSEIPREEILEWVPQRTVEKRRYSKDGQRILLPETTRKVRLQKPKEKLIYELSSGKLTIDRLLDEYIEETGSRLSREVILESIVIPIFQKLEETYHVVFYK